MDRRAFLKSVAGVGLSGIAGRNIGFGMGKRSVGVEGVKEPVQYIFPRWRGFNVLYFFTERHRGKPDEMDFKITSDWGFDFIRVPMSYWVYASREDAYKIKNEVLDQLDTVLDWGEKYGIHIDLNIHRAPGYCVNRNDLEPYDLFKDKDALDAFCYHWDLFAKRYKGISSEKLSFNLVNEPTASLADYVRVSKTAISRIRSVSPGRVIVSDGLKPDFAPTEELLELGVGQSCRGYAPGQISHYKASWAKGADKYPVPIWPDAEKKTHGWGRKELEGHYWHWIELAKKGVGVHCGECGCYNKTPHAVFLAWFRDVLEILTENNIGYALWNLRGSFGVLDSGRKDVAYEDYHGYKLDRKLFELLKEF